MTRRYFGTDGVRGKVGDSPITPDFVMRLGFAAGQVLVSREALPAGDHPAVLIGKDTRISGYMLEAALEAGFAAAGVDVSLVGPMPTPAVAYLTRALRLQAGVVISASHNPFYDNGIKFFSSDGNKLPDEVEQAIERAVEETMGQPLGCVPSERLGKARRVGDAAGRYIEFCKSTFPNDLDLRGLKIVVDCAHGAAYHIAPHVFHELGADVVAIGAAPDGLNINAAVGATHVEALQQAVAANDADLGIALDGDADRVMMVGRSGRVFDGDLLLYAIIKGRHGSETVDGAVGTLMSNLALENALKGMGVGFARAAVGDRYVLELMKQKGWRFGAENSGHIICLDRHTTGDGIVAALQVLTALRQADQSLDDFLADISLYPQRLINVPMAKGAPWRDSKPIASAVSAVEAEMGSRGRVLLRPSGTEPVLRVMVEGQDRGEVDRAAEGLAGEIKAHLA
ncbi:MAG TPA: phosphoglucosamine mutase [Rhodocyclaceae bacterium]